MPALLVDFNHSMVIKSILVFFTLSFYLYYFLLNNLLLFIFYLYRTQNCMFDIVWHGDGTASIKAANDKYIVPKGTGSMYATSDSVTDKEKFKVKIVNRPLLVLKSDFGFVGAKNPNAEVWEFNCNKVTHDVLFLTPSDSGTYTLKGIVVIY